MPGVLLVDPFTDEREMFCDLLAAAGVAVIAVESETGAIRAASGTAPAVMIVRAVIQTQAGFALVSQLRAAATNPAPAVILTTDGFNAYQDMPVGVEKVLLLPVLVEELVSAIHQLFPHE